MIPSLLVLTGVALAARVVYRKIPKDLTEWNNTVAGEDFGPTFYQNAFSAFSLKARQAVLGFSTKFVYKLKITSLKTDNFFNHILKEMRKQKSDIDTAPELAANREPSSLKSNRFEVETIPIEEKKPTMKIPVLETAPEKTLNEERSSFAAQEHQFINQLAYNPKDVSAYKHLGWLYLENNKPMEARQAFKMAIKLGSRDKMIMAKLLEVGGVLHKEGTVVSSRLPTGKQDVSVRTVTLKPVVAASYSVPPSPKTTAGHSDRSNMVVTHDRKTNRPARLAKIKIPKIKPKKLKIKKV
ncbi:MAG: hypothetical protein HYT38_01880 [Candidatus Sungbacteria bacterium]|uniref:Tetratricopeptide repeat protein n=1 Tax=Candidatus Sungiibacteriota bacterium TaxID=2750080 RepID=A0A9D6DR11_9BACT|nr:hypothetical protein [Candidatus Sungbacteria bacterium]